jgi:thiamine biosynthesis lipoprotein
MTEPTSMTLIEASETFACFGAVCAVLVMGEGPAGRPHEAVAVARGRLLEWHERFTRFEAASELSRLNADLRHDVPVSPPMARFAAAVVTAAGRTAGLVDATLLDELEDAGYDGDLGAPLPLQVALRLTRRRAPATANAWSRWHDITIDLGRAVVSRPPGVRLDGGGLVKGLAADILAEDLGRHDAFAVDCAGDLRLGGTAGLQRRVEVQSPFDGSVIHHFDLAAGGIATSGIGRRSWLDRHGRPAHHLIDPGTGRPAFTGVVQATALAPTGLEAEIRSKAAVLSGPAGAEQWLPDGGVLVLDDGRRLVVPART